MRRVLPLNHTRSGRLIFSARSVAVNQFTGGVRPALRHALYYVVMALNTAGYKSIGLILGIALVGVVFVVATVVMSRTRDVPVTAKVYTEPVSGIVFDAPVDWAVGTASTNVVQLRAHRLSEIQAQKSTCSQFSEAISKAIRAGLENGPNASSEAWSKEYPGLAQIATLTSSGGMTLLVGIDTCNPSLNQRTLTFRGQLYRNDAEIRFSRELTEASELSQSDLGELALALTQGAAPRHQADYGRFLSLLQSIR